MTQKITQDRKAERGFTLVELAIVMIIIGLLIGGILKGQELIANARLASTIAGIKGYDVAINTFRDKYDAVPGDVVGANTRLPNCAAAPCLVAAGAGLGNGRIDSNDFTGAPVRENAAAFVQLSAADMISGVNTALGNVWGRNFPASEVGGGFHIAWVPALAGLPGMPGATTFRSGHYLALHDAPAGGVVAANGSLTPSQAFRIDNKLDDSAPLSGSVLSSGIATCTVAGPPVVYNEVLEAAACNVFIRIQQ